VGKGREFKVGKGSLGSSKSWREEKGNLRQERTGQDRTGQDNRGQDRRGQDRITEDRITAWDRT
jgi:hypothetical protein